jgi:hypothetical protein
MPCIQTTDKKRTGISETAFLPNKRESLAELPEYAPAKLFVSQKNLSLSAIRYITSESRFVLISVL